MCSRVGIAALVLICVATSVGTVAAQGCDDCREIKKELRGAPPGTATPTAGFSQTAPVVRAVLYWVKGCGHCQEVLDGILPALRTQYGPQLEVRLVEVVSTEDIGYFFDVAEAHGFARGRASVPFLLIGDRALMGVDQITAEWPEVIETFLAGGGVDWPNVGTSGTTSQSVATVAAGCDFATPCPDETAAVSEAPVARRTTLLGALPPIPVALGLAAVIGGGLAGALRMRRVRFRRLSAGGDVHPRHIPGDNDAA